jgi:transposase
MIRNWRGRDMLGRRERDQLELFITGSLRQFIPDEHVLARVDRVLDVSWLRGEVSDCYCLDDGRPGIDPEAAIRLMLAGLLIGIVHDRKLMREARSTSPSGGSLAMACMRRCRIIQA